MEVCVYAPQQAFYAMVQEHPGFLMHVDHFQDTQKRYLLMPFDEEELTRRAIGYFDSETIYLKEHVLYYENKLRSITFKMEITSHHIIVYNSNQNPFLPFLKRIYRNFLACEMSVNKETNIKVL